MTVDNKKDKILNKIKELHQEGIEFVSAEKKDEEGNTK